LQAAVEAEAVGACLAVEPGAVDAEGAEEPGAEAEAVTAEGDAEIDRRRRIARETRGGLVGRRRHQGQVLGEPGAGATDQDDGNGEHGDAPPHRLAPPSTPGVGATRCSRARASVSVSPLIRTSLSRPRSPRTTRTVEGATSSAWASRALTAALAAPSTGGAVTRTRRASSRQPVMAARAARGCTRTRSRATSGRGAVAALLRQ